MTVSASLIKKRAYVLKILYTYLSSKIPEINFVLILKCKWWRKRHIQNWNYYFTSSVQSVVAALLLLPQQNQSHN